MDDIFDCVHYNMGEGFRLKTQRFRGQISQGLGLQHVPIEEKGTQFPYATVEELLERARGKYASGMNKEGIVIRPMVPEFSYTLSGPLSMKVLNNDYLLKE